MRAFVSKFDHDLWQSRHCPKLAQKFFTCKVRDATASYLLAEALEKCNNIARICCLITLEILGFLNLR